MIGKNVWKLSLLWILIAGFAGCKDSDEVLTEDHIEVEKEYLLSKYKLFNDGGEVEFNFVYEDDKIIRIDYVHFGSPGKYDFIYEDSRLKEVYGKYSREKYEYDTEGTLIEIKQYEGEPDENDEIELLMRYTLEYSTNNRLSKVQKYRADENGEMDIEHGYMTYEYNDDSSNPVKETSFSQDGDEKSVTLYGYETKANPFIELGISTFMATFSGDGLFGINENLQKSIDYTSELESFSTQIENTFDENDLVKEMEAITNGSTEWSAEFTHSEK